MKNEDKLLARYFKNRTPHLLPWEDVQLIIVIPVKADEEIFRTLDSINKAVCNAHPISVGIIIVLNHSVNDASEICNLNSEIDNRLQVVSYEAMPIHVIQYEDSQKNQRGVGYARQVGMDSAANYFLTRGVNGIICSLDADTDIDTSYISETIKDYQKRGWNGISYGVHHRYNEVTDNHKHAIINYELNMLYNAFAQRYIGHPYHYITIGSGFATTARAYIQVGGMCSKEAGEDFYFIQKLIANGGYSCLPKVHVYPSARLSFRTPFGTGQGINDIITAQGLYLVYNVAAYIDLKTILDMLPQFYNQLPINVSKHISALPLKYQSLLTLIQFEYYINESNANTSTPDQFIKRFFNQFNGFKLIRYMNTVHESIYKKQSITDAALQLIQRMYKVELCTPLEALLFFHSVHKS
ncbi:MAG: glycosyltransferase [Marinifilaceae bacterium]